MANSSFNLKTYGRSVLEAKIEWQSTSNGTAKNNSSVKAALYFRRNDGYSTYGTWFGSLNIGGTVKKFESYFEAGTSWIKALEFTATQAHKANGVGECSISGEVNAPLGTSLDGTYAAGSKTVTLDWITRQATIISAPNFTDEDNPTIKYSNPAGKAAQQLSVCISFDQTHDNIKYRDIPTAGSSYTFTFTPTERETLQQFVLNCSKPQKPVYFHIRTKLENVYYYNQIQKVLTIKNAEPTLNPNVVDVNKTTTDLTGNNSVIIKGFSTAQYGFNAQAKKFSKILSYELTSISGDGSTASGQIPKVETNVFDFKVTDNRGFVVSKRVTKQLVKYFKPTCNLSAKPILQGGELINIHLDIAGNIFNESFGKVTNARNIYYRYGEEQKPWSEWIKIDSSSVTSSGKYSAHFDIQGLSYTKVYEVQTKIVDSLSEILSKVQKVKALPVFDWSEDDFNFNVPVSIPEGRFFLGKNTYGINMNNSDIVKVNSIYFNDKTNAEDEGINFMRDNGSWDSLKVVEGNLLMQPDFPNTNLMYYYVPCYSKGDTIELSCYANGMVTNGGTSIRFTVPINHPILPNTVITLQSLTGTVRGVKGYMDGSGVLNLMAGNYSSSCRLTAEGNISIIVDKNSAWSNTLNNTPITISLNAKIMVN